MTNGRWLILFCFALVTMGGCDSWQVQPAVASEHKMVEALVPRKVIEVVYNNGLQNNWQDWGWATREVESGKAARLNLSNYAGWILAKPNLEGRFGGLLMQLKLPPREENYLEVHLGSDGNDEMPRLVLSQARFVPKANGNVEVFIPMKELNPGNDYFDRLRLRASKQIAGDWLVVESIGFTEATEAVAAAGATAAASRAVRMKIRCDAAPAPISPLIYGIAKGRNADTNYLKSLSASGRRWGGNATSRYNWQLGNAWNTASDWFFMNVNKEHVANYNWTMFFDENDSMQMHTAITLPTIGWVAKDTRSYSFPVSVFGAQEQSEPDHPDAGNGVAPDGKPLKSGSPTRSSVAAPPAFIAQWVKEIAKYKNKRGNTSPTLYFLDNEPMLWHDTHRDIHPDPVTYDELLERTIAYGSAARAADANALLAGPAEWGWPAYFYSALDAQAGFDNKPDRLKHGDEPLLAWYLRNLQQYEKKTGVRVLDYVDVHYYPQAKGIYRNGQNESVDARSAALRLRQTRSLWDPSYRDESWINDNVALIPRLKQLIADNYPGRGVIIGEYNFGAERHMSGGLAQAEVLGRFGQQGVYAAYYWTHPQAGSPAFVAFNAFRNYDGKGSRFLDMALPTEGEQNASLFASKSADGQRMVLVGLNLDPNATLQASITTTGCNAPRVAKLYYYTGQEKGLTLDKDAQAIVQNDTGLEVRLRPYSINVIELARQ